MGETRFVLPEGVNPAEVPIVVATTTRDSQTQRLEDFTLLTTVEFLKRGYEYCRNYFTYSAIDWWLNHRKTEVPFETCSVWVQDRGLLTVFYEKVES